MEQQEIYDLVEYKNKLALESYPCLFFQEKPYKLLVKIKESKQDKNNCSALIRDIATYSHGLRVLKRLEGTGLVFFEKKGRGKVVKLTEKGNKIADIFKKIKNLSE